MESYISKINDILQDDTVLYPREDEENATQNVNLEGERAYANVHFLWVAARPGARLTEFSELVKKLINQNNRIGEGLSYIELGAILGSQEMALRFIALGDMMGMWQAVTPKAMGIEDEQQANELAGLGLVMYTPYNPKFNII